MPELPEVEVLARHLAPRLRGQIIRAVFVRRPSVLAPTSLRSFKQTASGATFLGLRRRGKYLLFELRARSGEPVLLLGHLGMTGRMFLASSDRPLPKHAAVILNLGTKNFIYEDPRAFGRLTLDTSSLAKLGPEPGSAEFSTEHLAAALKRFAQPIKVKLLDQSVVAGVGNIYASEALFLAGISPLLPARRLTRNQVNTLRLAILQTLANAVEVGSKLRLHYGSDGLRDGLFYFGSATPPAGDQYGERLMVYDRAGAPCRRCGRPIRRVVQAGRSTFYCARCQTARSADRTFGRRRQVGARLKPVIGSSRKGLGQSARNECG